jgi:hypothetical protein
MVNALMSETLNSASIWPDDETPEVERGTTHETTGGGHDEIHWVVVERTNGLLPAQIKAGRLSAEGIPVRAWAESAGVAYGLTVGLLGTGFVAVPEAYADQAQAILAIEYDEEE